MLGKKAVEFEIETNVEHEMNLNLPSGIYFILAISGNAILNSKIVVEN